MRLICSQKRYCFTDSIDYHAKCILEEVCHIIFGKRIFGKWSPKNYCWFGFYMQAIAKTQACLVFCLSHSTNSQLVLYDSNSSRTGCPRKIALVSVRMCQILGDNFLDDNQKASITTPITSKRTNSENPKLIVRCQLNCNWTPTFCPPSHCRCV